MYNNLTNAKNILKAIQQDDINLVSSLVSEQMKENATEYIHRRKLLAAHSLFEKAPPDKAIETWIQKNKERFQDQYGKEKGMEVLYGRAWNMYNSKKKETQTESYTPNNYTDIGHNRSDPDKVDYWVWEKGRLKVWSFKELYMLIHGSLSLPSSVSLYDVVHEDLIKAGLVRDLNYAGRIDHENKRVSIRGRIAVDPKYAKMFKDLQRRYPKYTIWGYGAGGFQPIHHLNEASGPDMTYMDIGHRDSNPNEIDLWVWDKGRIRTFGFVDLYKDLHGKMPGKKDLYKVTHDDIKDAHSPYRGRIDHEKRKISISRTKTPSDRTFSTVLKKLYKDYPNYTVFGSTKESGYAYKPLYEASSYLGKDYGDIGHDHYGHDLDDIDYWWFEKGRLNVLTGKDVKKKYGEDSTVESVGHYTLERDGYISRLDKAASGRIDHKNKVISMYYLPDPIAEKMARLAYKQLSRRYSRYEIYVSLDSRGLENADVHFSGLNESHYNRKSYFSIGHGTNVKDIDLWVWDQGSIKTFNVKKNFPDAENGYNYVHQDLVDEKKVSSSFNMDKNPKGRIDHKAKIISMNEYTSSTYKQYEKAYDRLLRKFPDYEVYINKPNYGLKDAETMFMEETQLHENSNKYRKNWFSIGHYSKNSDLWFWIKGRLVLEPAHDGKKFLDHTDYKDHINKAVALGRIDHDKKEISSVWYDETPAMQRYEYVLRKLSQKYPKYKIHYLASTNTTTGFELYEDYVDEKNVGYLSNSSLYVFEPKKRKLIKVPNNLSHTQYLIQDAKRGGKTFGLSEDFWLNQFDNMESIDDINVDYNQDVIDIALEKGIARVFFTVASNKRNLELDAQDKAHARRVIRQAQRKFKLIQTALIAYPLEPTNRYQKIDSEESIISFLRTGRVLAEAKKSSYDFDAQFKSPTHAKTFGEFAKELLPDRNVKIKGKTVQINNLKSEDDYQVLVSFVDDYNGQLQEEFEKRLHTENELVEENIKISGRDLDILREAHSQMTPVQRFQMHQDIVKLPENLITIVEDLNRLLVESTDEK